MTIRLRVLLAALLVLMQVSPISAGLVTRPTKTCGTTSFVAEVAGGCTTIKASEVDGDINQIITAGVNNIETANINAAGLASAAIANLAITTGKINDLAVTTAKIADLNVTKGKLAVGATINTSASAAVTTQTLDNTEKTLVTLAGITTRGGTVTVAGTIYGTFSTIAVGGAPFTCTFRIYRDVTVIQTLTTSCDTGASATIKIPTSIAIHFEETPAAGTYVYAVKGQLSSANAVFATTNPNAGTIFAREDS